MLKMCVACCKLYLANYVKRLWTAAFEFIIYQLLILQKLPGSMFFRLFIKLYKTSAHGCFLVYALLVIIYIYSYKTQITIGFNKLTNKKYV